MRLNFWKMNGAGNDFVVIDNRKLDANLNGEQIEKICDRNRGVGADGLLAVEPAENGADYKFRYYNADGGEAEMCGNGARCFGRFTADLNDQSSDEVSFETIAGTLTAKMIEDDVQIAMSDPVDLGFDLPIAIEGLDAAVHFLNTGVPHAVVFVDSVSELDVVKLGAAIRYHQHFAPNGTNVNFVEVLAPGHIRIRTYERGVENETLACGTGMVACALLHHLIARAESPVKVDVKGGDTLEIGFQALAKQEFRDVTLTGPADMVFEGEIEI